MGDTQDGRGGRERGNGTAQEGEREWKSTIKRWECAQVSPWRERGPRATEKGKKNRKGENKKEEKRYPAKIARQERDKPKRLREKETKISCWGRGRKDCTERRRRRGRAARVEVVAAAAVEGCSSRAGSANERWMREAVVRRRAWLRAMPGCTAAAATRCVLLRGFVCAPCHWASLTAGQQQGWVRVRCDSGTSGQQY